VYVLVLLKPKGFWFSLGEKVVGRVCVFQRGGGGEGEWGQSGVVWGGGMRIIFALGRWEFCWWILVHSSSKREREKRKGRRAKENGRIWAQKKKGSFCSSTNRRKRGEKHEKRKNSASVGKGGKSVKNSSF